MTAQRAKFLKFFQKSDFSAVFENFLNFFFDFSQLDIAFNACIKELESNTPKCDFSWGGRFCPPPWHTGNERPVGNRVKEGQERFQDNLRRYVSGSLVWLLHLCYSFNRVIVKLHSIRPNSSGRSLAPLIPDSHVRGHDDSVNSCSDHIELEFDTSS